MRWWALIRRSLSWAAAVAPRRSREPQASASVRCCRVVGDRGCVFLLALFLADVHIPTVHIHGVAFWILRSTDGPMTESEATASYCGASPSAAYSDCV